MNIARTYNCIIAGIVIIIYLTIPVTGFGQVSAPDSGPPGLQAVSGLPGAEPCDDCPCSHGSGTDCCDTVFCSCQCHAPLSPGLRLTYAPVVSSQRFQELSWSLPQVYRSIFVPPQNIV